MRSGTKLPWGSRISRRECAPYEPRDGRVVVCGVGAAAGRTRRMGRPVTDGREQEDIRARVDVGEWDWREEEQWRREQELSRHDFEEPFKQ